MATKSITIDYLAPLKLNIRTLKFFGAWITPESSIWYQIYGHTFQFIFLFGFAINALLAVPLLATLNETMANISVSFTLIGYTFKFLNMYFKRHMVQRFFETMNSSDNQFQDSERHSIVIEQINAARKIIYSQFAIFVMGGSSVLLQMYWSTPTPAYRFYYPDWRASFMALVVTCVFESIGALGGALCNVSVDMFVPYFLLVIAGHVDVLSVDLRRIAESNQGFENNKRELLRCVQRHQAIVKMASDFEDIFSNVTMVQIFLSGVINCGLLFVLSTLSPTKQPEVFYMNTVFVSGMLLQIFIPCYSANVLKYKSEALKQSVFDSNWINTEVRFQKLILYFMLRLEKPVQINAGGALILGLDVFTKISNFTYSSFTLLRRINGRIN